MKKRGGGGGMKKVITVLVCSCFVLMSIGMAESGAKAGRRKGADGCGMYEKFYSNVKIVLKNSEKLGLTDAQREQVKEMKYDVKKNKIQACADINLLSVDISKALWQKEVDLDEVNALIDQKYQSKAQLKKDMVGAYVALNSMLSPEQRDMVKSIYKCRKAETCQKAYGKKSKGKMAHKM